MKAISQLETTPFKLEQVIRIQGIYNEHLQKMEEERERARTKEEKKRIDEAISKVRAEYDKKDPRNYARTCAQNQSEKKRRFFSKIGSILDQLFF
jgi:hypothetical protein